MVVDALTIIGRKVGTPTILDGNLYVHVWLNY
jgi:hypothetical protein